MWALALSAIAYFALCPTPIRSATIAAGAALPTLALWHDLNSVFSAGGSGNADPDLLGQSILRVALIAAAVGVGQVLLDEAVELPAAGRRAVAIAGTAAVCLMLVAGAAAGLAKTDGHPVGWARHSLQSTVDKVGTESGQAAAAGQAESRFGSLDTGRYDLWKVALRGFSERPAQGYGAGNFGYLNVHIGHPFLFPFQAHSQLLEAMSTLGAAGTGAVPARARAAAGRMPARSHSRPPTAPTSCSRPGSAARSPTSRCMGRSTGSGRSRRAHCRL